MAIDQQLYYKNGICHGHSPKVFFKPCTVNENLSGKLNKINSQHVQWSILLREKSINVPIIFCTLNFQLIIYFRENLQSFHYDTVCMYDTMISLWFSV